MKAKLYEDLIKRIVRNTEFNLSNADKLDIVRSATTAGAVSANIQTLIAMGYEADHGDWEDRGCLRVGYIKIAGTVIVRNSEIDYNAVADLLKARPATTEEILKATRQEAEHEIERTGSVNGQIAWYHTHCGEIEMARFLGFITEERRAELEAEWKQVKKDRIWKH